MNVKKTYTLELEKEEHEKLKKALKKAIDNQKKVGFNVAIFDETEIEFLKEIEKEL